MRDFTIHIYCELRRNNNLPARYVILRHDVDKRPWYSLRMAETEAMMSAKASYYFRIGSESNNPDCIKRIAALGHEIGYHYEDMSLCHGDHAKAYEHFCNALDYFRQFYPVRTCCMHGAPMSKYDSRQRPATHWRAVLRCRFQSSTVSHRHRPLLGRLPLQPARQGARTTATLERCRMEFSLHRRYYPGTASRQTARWYHVHHPSATMDGQTTTVV